MPILNHPPDGPAEERPQPSPPPRYRCPYCGLPAFEPSTSGYVNTQRCRCHQVWYPCMHRTHNRSLTPVFGHSEQICHECVVTNGFYRCRQCREYYPPRSSSEFDYNYCPNCSGRFVICQDCNSSVENDSARQLNDEWYCTPCAAYQESLPPPACGCDACDNARSRLESRGYLDNSRTDPGYIHSWDFRPRLEFHGKGPLFLGMELELETGRNGENCLAVVRNHLESVPGLVYLKSDGSISAGFEMVTHPMTYEWARENFPWDMITELEQAGASTHVGVGMHVHVSRRGFTSPAHVYRWMKFIYRNSEQVSRIARRSDSNWAAFRPEDRRSIKHYCKGDHGHSRYCAINTQNSETFEVRVFGSSTKTQEIQAALGLSDASVRYTQGITSTDIVRDKAWEWSAFHAWVSDRAEYQPLVNEMEVQGCVS